MIDGVRVCSLHIMSLGVRNQQKPKELGTGGETLSGHCESIPDLGSDGHVQWPLSFHFHLLKC